MSGDLRRFLEEPKPPEKRRFWLYLRGVALAKGRSFRLSRGGAGLSKSKVEAIVRSQEKVSGNPS